MTIVDIASPGLAASPLTQGTGSNAAWTSLSTALAVPRCRSTCRRRRTIQSSCRPPAIPSGRPTTWSAMARSSSSHRLRPRCSR
ncbi:MAG: hypothetical protein MZW92_57900 [Comamonadaceae bacterium]|nr:hypothetical protein [Comamonadaceae bacterium]